MCFELSPGIRWKIGISSLDIVCYVDSDWAGCSKTRKSTSGRTAQILGSDMIHTSRTQATVALSTLRDWARNKRGLVLEVIDSRG